MLPVDGANASCGLVSVCVMVELELRTPSLTSSDAVGKGGRRQR